MTYSKPHTVYQIQVQLASSLQSYRISKRFSEFVALDSALRTLVDAPSAASSSSAGAAGGGGVRGGRKLEVSLPPKTFLSKPDIPARRAGLEVYLRYLCTSTDWCTAPPLVAFLQLPESARRAREEQGERGDFYAAVRDVRKELQIARRWLVSPPSAPDAALSSAAGVGNGDIGAGSGVTRQHAPIVEAKKHIATADQVLERVQRHARDPVSKQEARRRANIVDELGREILALVELASAKRATHAPSSAGAAGQAGAGSGGSAGTMDRERLLAGGVLPQRGRVLGGGAGKETAATAQLSNDGLLLQQREQIVEQDKLLDGLLPVLRRQRELGETIAREIDAQSETLDELNAGVDRLEGKVRRGRKTMDKLK